MLLQVILEGLGLGALLVLVCAIGIRKGAVGMVHLYSDTVQQRCIELGLTTKERIRRKAIVLKIVCLSIYIAYVWLCVYTLNGASGFLTVFWQCFSKTDKYRKWLAGTVGMAVISIILAGIGMLL